jgi:hypothetical protein
MEGGALMPDSENCEPMTNEVHHTSFTLLLLLCMESENRHHFLAKGSITMHRRCKRSIHHLVGALMMTIKLIFSPKNLYEMKELYVKYNE